jgi:hypothetical protein
MDTPTALMPTNGGRSAAIADAPDGSDAAPGPGWLVLRNCAIGGGGPRVRLTLLHPDVGIALLDPDPDRTNAVDRVRQALDARRFPAIFGGCPPIVRAVLPAGGSVDDLGRVLTAAFGAQPPLALAGGDAWIGTARAAIEAELPVAAPERLRARRRGRASPWRRAAAPLAVAAAASAAVLALVSALPALGPGDVARPGLAAPASRRRGRSRFARSRAAGSGRGQVRGGLGGNRERATGGGGGGRRGPARAGAGTAADARRDRRRRGGRRRAARSRGHAGGTGGGRRTPEAVPTPPPPPSPVPPSVPDTTGAPVEPSPRQQRRAAAPMDTTPPQAPAASARRAPPSAAASAARGGDAGKAAGRCRDILLRATMGEALSDADREHLRRGCQPRG